MSITVELPPPLDDELSSEARREGISVADHTAILLHLATALRNEGSPTPFRDAVRVFVSSRSLDAERVASVLDELVEICVGDREGGADVEAAAATRRVADADAARALLRAWRVQIVHGPRGAELGVDLDLDAVIVDMPPVDVLRQRAGRLRRPAAKGRYSHIGGGSEEFAREKPREIAREEEDRG